MDKFDNTLNINESVMKSLDYMIRYQNYLLLKMIKNENQHRN